MTALRKLHATVPKSRGQDVIVDLSKSERALLNHLRLIALKCRSAAREDLFEACRLLSSEETNSLDAHATALVKCLEEALGKRPKLLRPGLEKLTFDEAWLMRLLNSARIKDDPSFLFLLTSRVSAAQRHNLAFLLRAVAHRNDTQFNKQNNLE